MKIAMVIGEWILILVLHIRGYRKMVNRCVVAALNQGGRSIKTNFGIDIDSIMPILLILALLTCLPLIAESQALPYPEGSSSFVAGESSGQIDSAYLRPTEKTKVSNYVFDAAGPYPIVGAGIAAGINQISNAPPEWNQGVEGYSKRFGSDFGIAVVGTTTRYGLAEALKEDTLYYRCECRGVLPRVEHAVLSTLTARRGEEGHRVFSFPALVAPYAGSMTAVYGWYPSRFGAKDAFRIGNYSLLAYAGSNISLEFFYSGPHSLLHRMHLNNAHGSPVQGPNK
jgi:hypothetical protein